MDDFELEARLRTRLHRRFDDAPLPTGLGTNVSQALTTAARPVGLATRTGRLRLGWAVLAAIAVVSVLAIGIGKGLGPSGPGSQPTPTSVVPNPPEREFIVVPANGTLVGKGETSLADSVLSTRLRALGIDNFTSSADNVLRFSVPVEGPPDPSIRTVLAATGDLRIVPLPAADYGAGMRVATVGAPLPKEEPALLGWESIMAVTNDPTGSTAAVSIVLKPAAAQAFGDYTTAHVGETFAIVVDGRVALLPMVEAAITSGQITITPAPGDSFTDTAAILVGGEMPEAWRGATVPTVISQEQAEAYALAAIPGATVQAANWSVGLPAEGLDWQVEWNIEMAVPECPSNESCVWAAGTYRVELNGVTGAVIHIGPLQ
jgi:hypothetical protein